MTSSAELSLFIYVMSYDCLLNTAILCILLWNRCLKLTVSGSLRLSLRPFLGGTKTGGTNTTAEKGLKTVKNEVRNETNVNEE